MVAVLVAVDVNVDVAVLVTVGVVAVEVAVLVAVLVAVVTSHTSNPALKSSIAEFITPANWLHCARVPEVVIVRLTWQDVGGTSNPPSTSVAS